MNEKQFADVVELIRKARTNALKSVNHELITLYWNIGKYISKKIKSAEWGESVLDTLAEYIVLKHPEFKGYSNKNLWRMRQFYEIYKNSKLSAVLREISWTNNLLIFSKSKTKEEREFYIRLCIKEKYSSRELERQIDSGYYERTILSTKLSPLVRELQSTIVPPVVTQLPNTKVSALLTQFPKGINPEFKDTYVLDFLDLPKNYSEKDLRTALVSGFKDFVLEFGKDFAFVGEEYRLQVGKNDYFIDLLFYHRELQCLVAFELKIDDFKPEYLGKLNFYLEALDRDVKKIHENPSVGIILCKSKDKDVVEYALNRNATPALISEYKTKLIPKKVLRDKLQELFAIEENRNE